MKAPHGLCSGKLSVFIANESAMRCRVCNWIGWPDKEMDLTTGVIKYYHPHPRYQDSNQTAEKGPSDSKSSESRY